MHSRPVIVAIAFAALALFVASILTGCSRTLTLEKEGFKASYTNVGFDTKIGTIKIDRLADGSFSVEAGDINSEAGIAKAIAEGVAAGLSK